VIKELVQGRIGQKRAAELMGLCPRQVRRLQRDYEVRGDEALVHKLRGRPSNNRIGAGLWRRIKELMKNTYRGFGPTLACEHLAEDHGIVVGRESLRKRMRQWGCEYERRRSRPHRKRRERHHCYGEFVQMDTSEHDWFEGRGEEAVLITMIDDANSMRFERFYDADTMENNMRIIREYIERFGRPLALYVDRASHFKHTPGRRDPAKRKTFETQIQRALKQLEITMVLAGSPQAKGRVERSHGTDQDRMIKKMRLKGIATIEQANRFLDEVYLTDLNEKYSVVPRSPVNVHRDASGYDLDAIFCPHETRTVHNDLTIRVDNRFYQLQPPRGMRDLPKCRVAIERRLDGTLKVRRNNIYLPFTEIEQRPTQSAEAAEKPSTRKWRPPADHPWKAKGPGVKSGAS